jgi:hypothetical protein
MITKSRLRSNFLDFLKNKGKRVKALFRVFKDLSLGEDLPMV